MPSVQASHHQPSVCLETTAPGAAALRCVRGDRAAALLPTPQRACSFVAPCSPQLLHPCPVNQRPTSAGEVYALKNKCTHLNLPLQGRKVGKPLDGDCMVCPFHGSRFSLKDGTPQGEWAPGAAQLSCRTFRMPSYAHGELPQGSVLFKPVAASLRHPLALLSRQFARSGCLVLC